MAVHEAAHVLPPNERHVIAEAAFVKLEQTVAVPVLFTAHFAELGGLRRVIFLQAVREIFVNSGVLLFERDGEGENFLFGEAAKSFHATRLMWCYRHGFTITQEGQ